MKLEKRLDEEGGFQQWMEEVEEIAIGTEGRWWEMEIGGNERVMRGSYRGRSDKFIMYLDKTIKW